MCERTLGTELWGTSESAGLTPKPVWLSLTQCGGWASRAGCRNQEEMPDGLGLSVGFRKIPA